MMVLDFGQTSVFKVFFLSLPLSFLGKDMALGKV